MKLNILFVIFILFSFQKKAIAYCYVDTLPFISKNNGVEELISDTVKITPKNIRKNMALSAYKQIEFIKNDIPKPTRKELSLTKHELEYGGNSMATLKFTYSSELSNQLKNLKSIINDDISLRNEVLYWSKFAKFLITQSTSSTVNKLLDNNILSNVKNHNGNEELGDRNFKWQCSSRANAIITYIIEPYLKSK